MGKLKPILLAEDNPNDVELALEALRQHNIANRILVVSDGAEVLDYLYRRGKYSQREKENPACILLDLKMPKVDGLEVLKIIKNDSELKTIPVVMLTSSKEEKDIVDSYNLGVNAYVVKPVGFEKFIEAISNLGYFWAILNEPPLERE
ncbi:MAG: response regulator [Melioribacteraceae bacterium]